MKRTFIAIELGKEIQSRLKELQNKLKIDNPDVKWIKPKNIHLTLKFLGQTQEDKIKSIKAILNKLVSKFRSFNLEISGLGAFPNLKFPRIIWIGANSKGQNPNILAEIVKTLEQNLKGLEFKKEKRDFASHITIGRVRTHKNINNLKKSLGDNIDFRAGILKVTGISLIESKLTSSEPIYTILYASNLT